MINKGAIKKKGLRIPYTVDPDETEEKRSDGETRHLKVKEEEGKDMLEERKCSWSINEDLETNKLLSNSTKRVIP